MFPLLKMHVPPGIPKSVPVHVVAGVGVGVGVATGAGSAAIVILLFPVAEGAFEDVNVI